MTLNNEQEKRERGNHFLTLFIGECWHEIYWEDINSTGYGSLVCTLCSKTWHEKDESKKNPDFFTPNDFDRLRKWMEGNQAKLWNDYLYTIASTKWSSYAELLNNQLNPSNLVRFLVEHRAEWEWVECPKCHGKGFEVIGLNELPPYDEIVHLCSYCFTQSKHPKLKHPAATYLDSIGRRKRNAN